MTGKRSDGTFRVAVVICSLGRRQCLWDSASFLARQTRPPDRLIYVVTRPEDLPERLAGRFATGVAPEVILCKPGLARQRNAGLDRVTGDCDIVVFYDDDFLPAADSIAGVIRAFAAWPEVGGMTGLVLADGIHGPGLTHVAGAALLQADELARDLTGNAPIARLREGLAGLYGCNMACRVADIGEERFDESLPLYGWQEDIDFAARLPGARVKTDAFRGVHLGVKAGREASGLRLGYSQIANPWYLMRKGTMRPRFALRLALGNLLANHLRRGKGQPWIDRAGRARGNRMALADILRGRTDPGRILDL